MDTWVTEGQKLRKQWRLAGVYMPHRKPYLWCAILCVLVCGCSLVKPAHTRQTGESLVTSTAPPSSNDQVVAFSPPETVTTAPQNSPPPQLPAVRAAIVDPPPAPALTVVPRAQSAKIIQNAPVTDASVKIQTSHRSTNSVAHITPPQTTVTYLPREAAAAIVIKGPPRPPQPALNRIGVPLSLGIGLGAGLVALVFSAKRRFTLPSVRRTRKEELFLPGEFKLRDTAIEPPASFGMLAPERPVRRSKLELLVSVLASVTNAIRSLVDKLPMEQINTARRALWQRIYVPPLASPEQGSGAPVPSAEADPKKIEVSATIAAQKDAQVKPADLPTSLARAIPGIPGSKPVEATALELMPATKVAAELPQAPGQPRKETAVGV